MLKNDFSLGGIESIPDYRDIPLAAVSEAVSLPTSYFSDITTLPVWNQRKIGACVGFASGKKKQKQELDELTGTIIPFTPRFIYALAKSQDNIPGEGTYYRYGMKILKNYGCATEATLNNDTTVTHAEYIDLSKISQAAFDEAKKYSIAGYARVELDENSIKQAIFQNKGVLLGMRLGNEWWTDSKGNYSWLEKDILPLREPKSIISGHAVFLYGYDLIDGRTRFWFRNSWTDQWGQRGNGYFLYDMLKNYLVEAWSAVDLPNDWQKEVKELPPALTYSHYFGTDLIYGMKNDEVRQLQIALKIDGTFPKTVSETGNYFDITRKAVYDFQVKYNVASMNDLIFLRGKRVGPKTREKLNFLFYKP